MKKGTKYAHIFEPLDREQSMESLRIKSLYGLTQITKDLAAFIHRKSFSGLPDPDAPVFKRGKDGTIRLTQTMRGPGIAHFPRFGMTTITPPTRAEARAKK